MHIGNSFSQIEIEQEEVRSNKGRFYVLEANMKYGKEGFRKAGLDYDQLMESMIANEEI